MPAYRYVLADLLTDQTLDVLPLTGVTFERRISRTGALSATLDAPTPALVARAKAVHAVAGRAALWVYRDGVIWWGGILWSARASQGQRGAVTMSLSAATFDTYPAHRELTAPLTFTQIDQGVIMPSLWRTIQADPRGNIGVQADDQPTGILRDRTYLAGDGVKVGRLIEDMGNLIDGPEHTIDTYADGSGNRIKRFRVATRLGLPDARVVFQRATGGGGRLLSWGHDADAVDGGTTFQVRGDAPADATVADGATRSPRLYADDLLTAGWPLLDVTEDRPGVTDSATLTSWAWALRDAHTGASRTNSYTVQIGESGWSPNQLGDPVRIMQSDAWHGTADADTVVRPVGMKVTTPNANTPETVDLLFGER